MLQPRTLARISRGYNLFFFAVKMSCCRGTQHLILSDFHTPGAPDISLFIHIDKNSTLNKVKSPQHYKHLISMGYSPCRAHSATTLHKSSSSSSRGNNREARKTNPESRREIKWMLVWAEARLRREKGDGAPSFIIAVN